MIPCDLILSHPAQEVLIYGVTIDQPSRVLLLLRDPGLLYLINGPIIGPLYGQSVQVLARVVLMV